MAFNFNFSVNSSFGTKKKSDKRGLTAQEEYWLNRILRDHSRQIFIISILFLVVIFASIVFSIFYGDRVGSSGDFSVIRIMR